MSMLSSYRRPLRASTNLAERLGVEPSERILVLQISNLLHYRPAHAPIFGRQGGIRTHGTLARPAD
jgi:hypothetical protein